MSRLVGVGGVAPGVGKSTLCAGLRDWLVGRGLRVDHFREEDMATRPAFASVVEQFAATGVVRPATLLQATAGFVESIIAGGHDVVLADALIPFTHSLLAWGHDEAEIRRFLQDLATVLAPVRPVLVYLDGDPERALRRAAAREPGWLDWFVAKLAGCRVDPAVSDLATAAAYLRRERHLTLPLVHDQPWTVITIDNADHATPAQLRQTAQHQLHPLLN